MDNTILKNISDGFVKCLKDIGISQTSIVVDFGISAGQVSKVYNGTRTFTLDQISDISFHHKIPIAALVTRYMCKAGDNELFDLFEQAETNGFKLLEELDHQDGSKAAS